MKKTFLQRLVIFIFILPILGMMYFQGRFLLDYFTHKRSKCEYILPDAFIGWVIIEYGNPECPELKMVDGRLQHVLGSDGRLCTSNRLQDGYAYDRYRYVSNVERNLWIPPAMQKSSRAVPVGGNQVWHHESYVLNPEKNHTLYWFFVGPKQTEQVIEQQRQFVRNTFLP